jgi:hypothetical protein
VYRGFVFGLCGGIQPNFCEGREVWSVANLILSSTGCVATGWFCNMPGERGRGRGVIRRRLPSGDGKAMDGDIYSAYHIRGHQNVAWDVVYSTVKIY